MDVGEMCALLGVTSVPKFNGGLYYFRRSATAAAVFEYARSLIRRYDELGLRAFRGGASDEPLLAIALATHGIAAVDQLTAPVRYTQAASELVKDGVKTFVEVGPSNVLSGLMKRIDRSVKAIPVNDLSSLEKLKERLHTA